MHNGNNLMKTISSITKPCILAEDVFLMFTILENHYKTRFVSTLDNY